MKHLICTEAALVSRLPLIFPLCTKNVFPLLCESKQNLLGTSREMTTLAEKKKKKKEQTNQIMCARNSSIAFPWLGPSQVLVEMQEHELTD